MSKAEPQVINIDLDTLWEPAALGLRRGYVFTGLGINAASDDRLVDFHLPGLLKIPFVPDNVTPQQVADFKIAFHSWIVANGFREVVEAFGISLDRSYEACLLVRFVKSGVPLTKKQARRFQYSGIEEKLRILEAELNIVSRSGAYLVSINRARNCLSHRMGLIGPQDCNEPGKLVLCYKRLEILDGDENVIPVDEPRSYVVKEGDIKLRFAEARKEFVLGSVLQLSHIDLKYIFYTMSESGLEMKHSIQKFFEESGVQVKIR
jgi:hypothetical protein